MTKKKKSRANDGPEVGILGVESQHMELDGVHLVDRALFVRALTPPLCQALAAIRHQQPSRCAYVFVT